MVPCPVEGRKTLRHREPEELVAVAGAGSQGALRGERNLLPRHPQLYVRWATQEVDQVCLQLPWPRGAPRQDMCQRRRLLADRSGTSPMDALSKCRSELHQNGRTFLRVWAPDGGRFHDLRAHSVSVHFSAPKKGYAPVIF